MCFVNCIQPSINDRQSIRTLSHALHTPFEVQWHSKSSIGEGETCIYAEAAVPERHNEYFFLGRFAPK